MIACCWLIAFISASTVVGSSLSPTDTVSFVLQTFSPDERSPKAPRFGKSRTFSDWETIDIENQSETSMSPFSPTSEGIIPAVLLKRILKLQCWSDLKTWLKKYPEIAKPEFDALHVPLIDYLSAADFDAELIELILAHLIGPSVEDWLVLLEFVDFFIENSQVSALSSVINRAISLEKTEKHFKTLFYRILKEAEAYIRLYKRSNFDRPMTPYELLAPLAGKVPGFVRYDALFETLCHGRFSEFQMKHLFFFEPAVQVSVINAYFQNNGAMSGNGIIKFNLLEAASEYSLCVEVFELLLARIEVDKLDFKGHDHALLDPWCIENVLCGCIKRTMFGNQPRQAQLLIARFPELKKFVDTFIAEIPSAQFMSDPIWIRIVQESLTTFRRLRRRMFDECEFSALCVMEISLQRMRLLHAAFSDLKKKGKEADLVKALRMVLQYSKKDKYDWAEVLFIQCRKSAYGELLKLFEEAKISQKQAQIDYLSYFIRK